jgi:hypothetical protein
LPHRQYSYVSRLSDPDSGDWNYFKCDCTNIITRLIVMLKLKLVALPLALGLVALVPDLVRADTLPVAIASRSATPVYGQAKLVGRVERVQGATIVMALDNGTTRSVALPDAAGGDFSFLVGQRIVLTEVICVPPIVPPVRTRVPNVTPQKW